MFLFDVLIHYFILTVDYHFNNTEKMSYETGFVHKTEQAWRCAVGAKKLQNRSQSTQTADAANKKQYVNVGG